MIKKPSTNKLLLVPFFLIMIFSYSCRKSELQTTQQDLVSITKMDINEAKSYYEKLKKEEGVIVTPPTLDKVLRQDKSLKSVNNKKYATFKKAYESETYESTFVEVPILYDQRFSLVMTNPDIAKPITNFEQIEIFKYSFDRLVIYKSKKTGEIRKRLISYIPDISYLKKHNYKISHNQINRLDYDFTGFLEYKDWDGTPLYLLQYENGKKTRYISLKKQVNTESVNMKGKSSSQSSTSRIICNYMSVPIWGEACISVGPEGNIPQCTPYIRGYTTIQICTDDGLTGNPCIDYGICGNPPGGGGGTPPYTGDPCIDYGDCGGSTADCAGVLNGSAVMTPCGCIGGTTGIANCETTATESEAIDQINNLENPVTGDGIELYLVARYKGSKLLDLSIFSVAADSFSIGEYTITPHYDSNGAIVFFSAWRNTTNGIEYIIKRDQLSAFQSRIALYTAAANLVYIGGMPSRSQIQIMNGDYVGGLKEMWGEALKSPSYYVYLAHLSFAVATNLQPSTIQYTNITSSNSQYPNYRIDNMSFQQYKNAISNKYGPWKPTSTPGVESISAGGYRWTARTNAAEWASGFSVDYFNISTNSTIGKFRFTN